jgi:Tol biopolymer transport system component
MARFLRYIVENTESGHHEQLKERQIGIAVFDKPLDWDPKLDNNVRSEARRLRQKLDAYYETVGRNDPVRISIPKGAYCAEFLPGAQDPEELPAAALPNLHPIRPQSLDRRPAWVGVGLLVGVMVFALLLRDHPKVKASEDNFEIVPFADEIGQEFSPAVSPDGKVVAYVWDGNNGNYDLYSKEIATAKVTRLTTSALPDLAPAWSADGRRLAFLRLISAEMAQVELLAAGRETTVATIHNPVNTWIADSNPYLGCYGPAWTRDGRSLIVTDENGTGRGAGLYLLDLATGALRPLTSPGGETRDTCARVSPEGQTIAFARYVSHGLSDVYTIAADGSRLKRLTTEGRTIRGLDWSSDGSHVIFSSLRQGSFQLRQVSRNGGDTTLLPASPISAVDPSASANGNVVAFGHLEENWNIWRVPVTPEGIGTPELILSSTGKNHSPSYSPDSRQIAYVSDRSGTPEIWIADAEGKNLRQLTHFGGPWLGSIRWSPDGRQIAFDARPEGHSGIFTVPSAGGKPTLLERDRFEERRPTWSHDGKSIYFNSDRGGSLQIWKKSLVDGSLKPIAQPDTNTSIESEDGQYLYYATNNYEIWRCHPDGSGAEKLPLDLKPQPGLDWSLGKDGIYLAGDSGTTAGFFYYSLKTRTLREIGRPERPFAPGTPSLYVSPDGKWMLFAQLDHVSSEIKLRAKVQP